MLKSIGGILANIAWVLVLIIRVCIACICVALFVRSLIMGWDLMHLTYSASRGYLPSAVGGFILWACLMELNRKNKTLSAAQKWLKPFDDEEE